MTSLAFLKRMDNAWKEWGPIVTEWQESEAVLENSPPPVDDPKGDSEDDRMAWLARMNTAVAAEASSGDDTSWRKAMTEVGKFTNAEWDTLVELNRCAWCRTPSVVLKKCKGQCSTKFVRSSVFILRCVSDRHTFTNPGIATRLVRSKIGQTTRRSVSIIITQSRIALNLYGYHLTILLGKTSR